jgi:hypothetical protein
MDQRDIENILENVSPKKKIKSGKKGKRVELEVVKELNKKFCSLLKLHPDWGKFSRSVGSGNRWGQRIELSKSAKETYTGDIVCPDNFKFVLESKGGYNDIDLCSAFEKGHKELDGFLKQASDDAVRCQRKPMLIWKKDRKPRLAAVKTKELTRRKFAYSMKYRDWTFVNYKDLMKLDDDFFFVLD